MPDITGFTEFVNETEIEHGQHIISELLEIIINSDELNLTVNEIEGDAVLFYKLEKIPTFDKIVKQAISIFTNFHRHLKKYEHHRICDCGACSGASSLSLKMIAHTGELGFTTVHKQKKIYGKDLIVIHKLLKNDVDSQEYLLFSNELLGQFEDTELKSSNHFNELNDGASAYEKIGTIQYKYFPLTSFLKDIQLSSIKNNSIKVKNPLVQELWIDCIVDDVYEYLSNLKYRTEWTQGLNDLKYDEGKVNRGGTLHQCVVNDKLIDFETIKSDLKDGEIGFGEQIFTLLPGIKSAAFYYKLTQEAKGTKLIHETHIIPIPLIGWIMKLIMSSILSKNTKKTLNAFKVFCEKNNFS